MADKRRERFYYAQLRRALPELADPAPEEHEPPDFVARLPGLRVGVEFTAFHAPPTDGERPSREVGELRSRVVNLAEALHAKCGGPALYVTVMFKEHVAFGKREVSALANALAASVLRQSVPRRLEDPALTIRFEDVPPAVGRVLVQGSVNGTDKLWYASSGGWVAAVEAEHLRSILQRKASSVPVARSRCDALWLVIVEDLAVPSTPIELSRAAADAVYESPFDRLYWFDPHGPFVRALQLAQGA